ncbi:hypothetical protein NDU88_002702 [Pleurodeles waltl]|uniref:Uncharacterized protein n=1 Tax=Pleurodeles waltl TaxID=8319 RepID=A0AAV7VF56_PLEWA|nr:hypothetical protein NDU88_002702 [Pleurodeles waltl]
MGDDVEVVFSGHLCERGHVDIEQRQAVGTGGVRGGGDWRGWGFEAVVDVRDLLVESGGLCVAQFLGGWDVVDGDAGVGEFLHDVEEFFAVVSVVFWAGFEGGSLG